MSPTGVLWLAGEHHKTIMINIVLLSKQWEIFNKLLNISVTAQKIYDLPTL